VKPTPDHAAAERLASLLAGRIMAPESRSTPVTWLNHVSVREVLRRNIQLHLFSHVGIDGVLLKTLIGEQERTSADLVVPRLLQQTPGAAVALIGGDRIGLTRRSMAIVDALPPASHLAWALPGYGHPASEMMRVGASCPVDILIICAGAGLQEELALQAVQQGIATAAITCGGYLDQLAHGSYYPSWAYPLRLNWLVRIVREPRRLWRRYTVDVISAVRNRHTLRAQLAGLPRLD